MNQEDPKAGNGPQAPKPPAGTPDGSEAAASAPGTAAPDTAAPGGAAPEAAPKAAAAAAASKAAAKKAEASKADEQAKPAAGRAAARRTPGAGAAARAARAEAAGAADAPSTAAVSAHSGAAAAAASGGEVTRRGFLSWISAGWLAFGALTAGTLIGTVRYLFPNVLFEPPQTFRAGFPEEYTVGDVSTRFKDQFGVWIVRSTTEIYVLSTVCTHLGCTPNWLDSEQKFKCPCHGSGFRKTGINFEGPAPRPLERYRVALADDGQILVDKTRKYQWEKGEWSDPESFLAV